MKDMKSYNLQYYVDKLKKGEKFSLARYGDGEMYCMWGKQGQNSNGCRYSPELRQALLDSMKHKDDPSFIYGMQRVLPHDRERIEREYPDIDWHDTEIFSEAVANGELYPLIEQLRKMNVTIIWNSDISSVLPNSRLIKIPSSNAFDLRDEIISKIDNSEVIIFCCGMAANALIGELHNRIDAFLLDLGHIFDPAIGLLSRCDLEDKSLEELQKNYGR